ncbi:MAG TPA: acyl-protein synthetase [Polyangiaceae bacterium]
MTPQAAELVRESENLHARVRAFAAKPAAAESFDALALAIADFQRRHSPAFARLCSLHAGPRGTAQDIPAVPSDAFKLTRVAVHEEALDTSRFVTSGTTELERGVHPFRTTRTYAELSEAFGRAALQPPGTLQTVVALAAIPPAPHVSSLSFMFEVFMEKLDGRALDGGPFSVRAPDRWLLDASGVDRRGLQRAVRVAQERGEPLLLLATSLALLAALDGPRLPFPPGSAIMQTGGYKGRNVDTDPAELRARVSDTFGVPPEAVVSEYGMTELSSQLYEGTRPGAALQGPPGVYLSPSWLRVTPVDPITLAPVPAGEVGLARFVDLANVDSAVAIVTRDRIRERDGGIELLGREPGAPPRGCSLAVDALLGGERDFGSGV